VIPAADKPAPHLDAGEYRFHKSSLHILDARFRGHDMVGKAHFRDIDPTF
jgi:hypothetical protein